MPSFRSHCSTPQLDPHGRVRNTQRLMQLQAHYTLLLPVLPESPWQLHLLPMGNKKGPHSEQARPRASDP
jgi:hypothetical protein